MSPEPNIPSAWYPDPGGSDRYRWWDGEHWTKALISQEELDAKTNTSTQTNPVENVEPSEPTAAPTLIEAAVQQAHYQETGSTTTETYLLDEPEKKLERWILPLLLIVTLLAAGTYFYLKQKDDTPQPEPTSQSSAELAPAPTVTPSTTPTITPEPSPTPSEEPNTPEPSQEPTTIPTAPTTPNVNVVAVCAAADTAQQLRPTEEELTAETLMQYGPYIDALNVLTEELPEPVKTDGETITTFNEQYAAQTPGESNTVTTDPETEAAAVRLATYLEETC